MSDLPEEPLDPRILRTRRLLQQALGKLLENKEFESISIQDIADAATVNRVTFYDHYSDKFALLECMVGTHFHELLAKRDVEFDGSCSTGLKGVVLGLCDYLAEVPGMSCARKGQMEPHLESAVIAVVRRIILDGLKHHATQGSASLEMTATAMSWAIYGASKEWLRAPSRCPAEQVVGTIVDLVSPIMGRPSAIGAKSS